MVRRRTLLAMVCAAPVLAACAPDTRPTLRRATDDGVLRVGLSGARPFGYLDTAGRVTGAQPEVARAVLGRLGIGGIEAVQVRFEDLLPGLRAGQFDLVTAGMAIAPERCAQAAFSRPDYVAPPAFLVAAGNPQRLRSFADVRRAGVRLAVLSASVELGYACDAGVSEGALLVVETQSELVGAVDGGSAPVAVATGISLVDELRRTPGTGLEVTGPLAAQDRGRRVVPAGAFAMRTEDVELRERFDTELTALQRSGEWLRIVAPFGLTAANLPPDDLATESLCRA